ncbi:MAG: hypothetical protein E7571_00300 [Ruminococcaceae bacterium]|nr:hypothetical protein [Oscillospiraceae bacterium]
MGGKVNTVLSLVAALIDRSNRKKARKRINLLNEQNRNIQMLGSSTTEHIIPSNYQMGNISISGGTTDIRNALIIQNCKQSVSLGVPTIIIHEGNYLLEQLLQSTFSNHRYLRIINPNNPYYEPLFRLSDMEIGHFISDSSLKEHKIGSNGALYVSALSTILRKKGITPYTRMFANCPHGSINNLIVNMENSGIISANEADKLRNEVLLGIKEQAEVEYFFQQTELESPILAWKSNLSKCTSVSECILRNGIMSLDISSCGNQNQLSLISTEINNCKRTGTQFRIIVDAVSFYGNDKLIQVLKNTSGSASWTISSPDIDCMLGNTPGELATWLALSHRAILFSHGIKTCELLSAELGEYEHIDVVESHAGNNNIGRIGYHYGANSSFSTSEKRKRVIKPEEIESLESNEFIMLDNYTATISKGTLV